MPCLIKVYDKYVHWSHDGIGIVEVDALLDKGLRPANGEATVKEVTRLK